MTRAEASSTRLATRDTGSVVADSSVGIIGGVLVVAIGLLFFAMTSTPGR